MKKGNILAAFVFLTIMAVLFPGYLLSSPDLPKVQKELVAKNLQKLSPLIKARLGNGASPGCCWDPSDPSPLDWIIVAYFDLDFIEVKNFGSIPAIKGTLTVEWYDLYEKKMIKKVLQIPEIKPGESKTLIFNPKFIIAKKSEGITIRIDYTDTAYKSYHYQRAVKSCPDNY
jgi:hypothetical protein